VFDRPKPTEGCSANRRRKKKILVFSFGCLSSEHCIGEQGSKDPWLIFEAKRGAQGRKKSLGVTDLDDWKVPPNILHFSKIPFANSLHGIFSDMH